MTVSKKQAEREIKKVVLAFCDIPLSTREGINSYRRLERHIESVIRDGGNLSKWQRIRANIQRNLEAFDAELNRPVSDYFGFQQKKRGKA